MVFFALTQKNTMKIIRYYVVVVSILLLASIVQAQTPKDFCVSVSATVKENPPSISLRWWHDDSATAYVAYRRDKGNGSWKKLASLKASDSTYTDNTIVAGHPYEYKITKSASYGSLKISYSGYCCAGIRVPLPQHHTVVLLVDNTVAASLSSELTRLVTDLEADGWTVIRHDVSRTASIKEVKALVIADYTKDPKNVESVFLFGHIPVPYSGNLHPDQHPNHLGAWPADGYYGYMSSEDDWTDTDVNTDQNTDQPGWPRIRNIPGDGKFDQSSFPGDVDLMVGRVDLQGMSAFAKSEVELLRQYLNKDHNFRTGVLNAPSRGMIADHFGILSNIEAFASTGWRSFPPLVGLENTKAAEWFATLDTAAYLWAYGCGGGSFESADGIGVTGDFATKESKAIFNVLFGSYFGDWDVDNNFLRAPLCSSYGLTSAWSGRPLWNFHHMALGEPIGYSARITQNNTGDYDGGYYAFMNQVHIALMGDPTLRMHYTVGPSNLQAAIHQNADITLSWTAPQVAPLGYNIYRSGGEGLPVVKINTDLIASTQFVDATPLSDSDYYLVRAVTLEQTPSGTYLNESPGTASSVKGFTPSLAVRSLAADAPALRFMQNQDNATLTVSQRSSSAISIRVYDRIGRCVCVLNDGMLEAGTAHFSWNYKNSNGEKVSSGMYVLRVVGENANQSYKILVTK